MEEERATIVPNREGKAKSQWTVASFPWFTKGRPGLHVGSEILLLLALVSLIYVGTGPHVNETWCVISRAKCDLAALAQSAALFLDFLFLMACRSVLKND